MERGYKKGQGIRMSQDYGRCREMGRNELVYTQTITIKPALKAYI
jgi:hypothetical protein